MQKRRLKRQLGLVEVLMLGTAGTIAAEIFVLTGHVAGLSGPASVLALLLVGLLSLSLALNYCEMGTAFPETGGALTYVREAYGSGLLSYLVGSLDCLSSTFYAALSAVGFAYSLQIFLPSAPIVPVALLAVAAFTVLNVLGVSNVGRAQVLLGALLLSLLLTYIVAGFVSPGGFSLKTFVPEGRFFVGNGLRGNIAGLLTTMALIFNAYVGFELIVDDAEEVRNPNRNIPLGILISLGVITLTYVIIGTVTLGTVSWHDLAGSETALSDAASRLLPRVGAPLIGIAGIIATLTSVNTAMLSATREAFTLSRDGAWPRFMSRLGRTRTPVATCIVIGALVAMVAAIGLVDLLSYISSSGYLFVVFWATLAMMRLRRQRPQLLRPFKVPLYPATPIVAATSCVIVVAFTDWRALAFGTGVLAVLTLFFYLRGPVSALAERNREDKDEHDRILVAVANPRTAEGLARLALALARRAENVSVLFLNIVQNKRPTLSDVTRRFLERVGQRQRQLLNGVALEMEANNIPFSTRTRYAEDVAEGIVDEVTRYGRDKLVLLGWPGPLSAERLVHHPVRRVLQQVPTNVAVFLNRDMQRIRRILVPVGGSPHSRLALRLALELADEEGAEVVAMRCFCSGDADDMQDDLFLLREILEEEFGEAPDRIATRVVRSPDVLQGVLSELANHPYDLVVIGAAVAYALQADLFGSLTDDVAEQIPCSVLLVRRYEPVMVTWLRRRVKQFVRA